MVTSHPSKTVLSTPNAVGILVFLHTVGGTSKATIIWNGLGGNYASVKYAIERLRKDGLVTVTEVEGRSRHILVELTDLGRSVAELLKPANDLVLRDEIDLDDSASSEGEAN